MYLWLLKFKFVTPNQYLRD